MGLNVKQTKIYGIPIPGDKITSGTLSVTPVVVNAGDFATTGNINIRTYQFDLGGISLTTAEAIQADCDSNTEQMLLGNVNLNTGAGLTGGVSYRGLQLFPYQYEEKGGITIGNNNESLASFPVTFITNKFVGALG